MLSTSMLSEIWKHNTLLTFDVFGKEDYTWVTLAVYDKLIDLTISLNERLNKGLLEIERKYPLLKHVHSPSGFLCAHELEDYSYIQCMVYCVLCYGFIIAITGLELAIAFLQAYVWTTLTCLYLSDAINLH